MAEWFPLPMELQQPHPGHGAYLRVAQNVGWVKSNPEEYKQLLRNGKFVCKECGRVAAASHGLCAPEPQ